MEETRKTEETPQNGWKEEIRRPYKFVQEHMLNSVNTIGGIGVDDLEVSRAGLPLVFLYYVMMLLALLYFTVTGTLTIIDKRFLALVQDPDSTCIEVPLITTATFQGDFNGNWETKNNFRFNSSVFVLEFKATSINNKQYSAAIIRFKQKMSILGARAKSNPSLWSAMVYSAFSFTDAETGLRFYSNVDAAIINDQPVFSMAYSSRDGVCNSLNSKPMYGAYDKLSKSFVMHIPLDKSNADPYPEPCPKQGYMGQSSAGIQSDFVVKGEYTLSYDVRTISTVVALNLGIITTAQLVETVSVFADDGYFVAQVPGSFFIDPFFAPMQPIFCIDKKNVYFKLSAAAIKGPDICFLVNGAGGSYNPMMVYPIMGQAQFTGDGTTFFPCTCPHDQNSFSCNEQDYFYIFVQNIYGDTHSIVSFGINMQQIILPNVINGFNSLFANFTNVMSYSLLQSYGYNSSETGYNQLLQESWDAVCPDQDCSAVIFESYGTAANSIFPAINPFNLQFGSLTNASFSFPVSVEINSTTTQKKTLTLPRQMCVDSFSNNVAMTLFSKTAPVNLTQTYLECQSNLKPAVLASIGNAAGSAQLYAGFAITFIGCLFVFMYNRKKEKMDMIETQNAKKEKRSKALYDLLHEVVLGSDRETLNEKWKVLEHYSTREENEARYDALLKRGDSYPEAQPAESKLA